MKKTSNLIIPQGYWASIRRQPDRTYQVEFPDWSHCIIFGDSLKEAVANAGEALSGVMEVALDKGITIPFPSQHRGRGWHLIHPDLDVMIPWLIYLRRRQKGLTQSQVAKAMGVTQQTYRTFERVGKSNPRLSTVAKLAKVLEFELLPAA